METFKFSNNIKFSSLALFLLGITFFLGGCSAGLNSGIDNTYTLTLGDAEEQGVQEVVTRLRNNHHYEIERNDTYTSGESRVTTYWKKSPPFSKDPNYKAQQVETRIILTTRLRSSQGYRLFRIKFQGEYRALMPTETGGSEFQKMPLTEEAEDYFKDIAYDLKDQVSGSSRGF
ncbi:MAG: hypothetical protein U5J95_05945 [Balneolaceae bacterium]|nr:hypothetical protein [Balneolaceae bacterium]